MVKLHFTMVINEIDNSDNYDENYNENNEQQQLS